MSRDNGTPLSGQAHLIQSIKCLVTTLIGTRVMRRYIGIDAHLLDEPMNRQLAALWVYEIAKALKNVKETRFELLEGKIDSVDRLGHVYLRVFGKNLEVLGDLDVILKRPTIL